MTDFVHLRVRKIVTGWLAMLLAAALCAGCAAGGQAPAPEPSATPEPESPSSVSESVPEPVSEPEPAPEETSSSEAPEEPSQPEEPSSESRPEKEQVPAPEPDGLPLPPQGEVNPDFGYGDENPDTSSMYTPEELESFERINELATRAYHLEQELMPVFGNIKDSFSYFRVVPDEDNMKVVLEIGVVQKDVIDSTLNNWEGDPWDDVAYVGDLPVDRKKLPSVTEKETFAEAVNKLNIAPGFSVLAEVNPLGEIFLTGGLVPQEEVERWRELPQAVKELAEEMGIPEDMLEYMPPRSIPEEGSNPDT